MLGADVEDAIVEYLLAMADVGNAVPVDLLPAKDRDIAAKLFSGQDSSGFVVGKDRHERLIQRRQCAWANFRRLSNSTV